MSPVLEGLWTAEFGSSKGAFGGGVVVFQNGKLAGGDATHFYIGEYVFAGQNFKATLQVSPFIAGAQSVFSTIGQDLTLDLVGFLLEDGRVIANGTARGIPDLAFGAKLLRRHPAPWTTNR